MKDEFTKKDKVEEQKDLLTEYIEEVEKEREEEDPQGVIVPLEEVKASVEGENDLLRKGKDNKEQQKEEPEEKQPTTSLEEDEPPKTSRQSSQQKKEKKRKKKEKASKRQEEEDPLVQIERKVARHRRKRRCMVGLVIALLVIAVVVAVCYVRYHTFTDSKVTENMETGGGTNGSYSCFGKGLLRYGKEGASYVELSGKVKWSHSAQLANPTPVVNKDTALLIDAGGNDMLVVTEAGIKGEIHTNLPIERAAVSQNGIVAAVLRDGMTPRIVCYDAKGSVLVEQKSSMASRGYPMGIAVSDDGKTLMVSYLKAKVGQTDSCVVFYDFGGLGKEEKNYEIFAKDYQGVLIPECAFVGGDTAMAVGTDGIHYFSAGKEPKEHESIKVKGKIQSVFTEGPYIGLLIKRENRPGFSLEVYNIHGKEVLHKHMQKQYSHIKIYDKEVLMYDGNRLCIVNFSGTTRFDGELSDSIREIRSVFGVNLYAVMNEDGIRTIRLTK